MEKKFKLSVAVRLMILMNLPNQGSILDMINKRNIRKKVDFSSEEMEELNITSKDNKISWTPNNKDLEVVFTEKEIIFLRNIINNLDASNKITDNILDFAQKILEC